MRKKRNTRIVLIVIAVLIIVRLILPYVLLDYANKSLSKMKGYNGKIEDINLALIRGAYKIKKIYIHKKDNKTGEETEFFDADVIDLSIEWRALLNGKITGEIEMQNPELRFTKDKTEPRHLKQDTVDFRQVLDNLMPLKVNRLEIINGIVKYSDPHSSPPVDVYMSSIHLTAENLTNVKSMAALPSTVNLSSEVHGGTLDMNVRFDPFAQRPRFDMNAELSKTDLTKMNSLFKAYGKFDVTSGSFGLYTEIAAKDGKFVGYVKPVIKDLKVIGPQDKDDNVLNQFWEGVVGLTGIVFRNQRHDQVATKIPMQGTFSRTKVNLWFAVLDLLSNAFIQALQPSIDHEIKLRPVNSGSEVQIIQNDKKNKKNKLKNLFNKKDREDKDQE